MPESPLRELDQRPHGLGGLFRLLEKQAAMRFPLSQRRKDTPLTLDE